MPPSFADSPIHVVLVHTPTGLPLDPSVARTPLEGGASSTEPESRERAAAALGYVASAVHLIAEYLGVRPETTFAVT